jgi:hypothetical protein
MVTGIALAGGLFASATLYTSRVQLPKPHEYHLMLQGDVGVWDGEFEMALMDQKLQGKIVETVESFGDFWTIRRLEGSILGTPFHGTYQLGYDPGAQEFMGTWIDTLSHNMAVMRGQYAAEARTLRMEFKGPDMLGNEVDHWNTSHYDALGRRIFESWVRDTEGKEVRTMTITFTRRLEQEDK